MGSSATTGALRAGGGAFLGLGFQAVGNDFHQKLDDSDVVDLEDLRADLGAHPITAASAAVGDDAQLGQPTMRT